MQDFDLQKVLNPNSTLVAAIDLGSNTCRLTLADVKNGHPEVVETFSRIVRLGENVATSHVLSIQAMERAASALKVTAAKVKEYRPSRIRSVATEACRRAKNSLFFQKFILDHTGIDLEIIDSSEEARLSLLGCRNLFDYSKNYVVVFDIGGGSSEVILADIRDPDDIKIIDFISLTFGVVNLAEIYGNYCGFVFNDIRDAVVNQLSSFGKNVDLLSEIHNGKVQLIGCSGTSTTIAALHLNMRVYNRESIDGTLIAQKDIDRIRNELSQMSPLERSMHPCIGPGRNDLVIPGLAIFAGIYDALPTDKLLVADRGVRDGILIEFAEHIKLLKQSA